jgi:hypothetical protein
MIPRTLEGYFVIYAFHDDLHDESGDSVSIQQKSFYEGLRQIRLKGRSKPTESGDPSRDKTMPLVSTRWSHVFDVGKTKARGTGKQYCIQTIMSIRSLRGNKEHGRNLRRWESVTTSALISLDSLRLLSNFRCQITWEHC